jgi:tripartite motif-containing protein 71
MKKVFVITGFLVTAVLLFSSTSTARKETYQKIAQWGEGVLNRPMDIAWEGGFLYVADAENQTITIFKDHGTLVRRWRGFKRPISITAKGNNAYVVDFLADEVVHLKSDGTEIRRWGRHGRGEGEFDGPSGIAVDSQANVYVSDFYNHRVQKFTQEGRFVLQWGGNGRWGGSFHYPTDVAIGPDDQVYVADAYNQRIQKFTRDGRYLTKWGGIGFGFSGGWRGWFRLAKAVTLDSRGNVYVADAFNRRIQKFTAEGRFIATWGEDEIRYAAGVAVDSEGQVYVADFFNNRILVFAPKLEGSP